MEEVNNSELIRAIGKLEGKMDLMVNSVSNLASSFESLEKGRLSRLEIGFATLNTEVKDKARNTAVWSGAIVAIIVSVATAVIINVFKLY